MRVNFCENCGAPLDAAWETLAVTCRFCGVQSVPGAGAVNVAPSMPADGRPRLVVGGRTYVLEGLLGRGDACDVYRGRWAIRLGELVVVKVLRSPADADLVRAEWDVLGRLREVDGGEAAEALARRLPEPVAIGPVRRDGERLVAVYRWRSGFQHSLEDVAQTHPAGVSGQIATWLLKRVLEVLGLAHRRGFVHGAVIPPHVLVHPRDHGATLVGWGLGGERGPDGAARLRAVSRRWARLYPDAALRVRVVGPATDVAMAARCALGAAGAAPQDGRARPPASLPGDLGALVAAAADGAFDDAWALLERLTEASGRAFGPPSYNPLPMPGWDIAAPR